MRMKRKILFLIESLAGGGAEKVLTTLIQHIDRERFEVMVCAISGGGLYEKQIQNHAKYEAILKVPSEKCVIKTLCYRIKHHLVYKWLPLSWVYGLFLPHGSDVEIAYVEGFATKLLSHSTNRKARKYAWIHTDLCHNHWTASVYATLQEEAKVYKSFDKIVGVSHTVIKAFRTEFPNIDVSRQVIYNPINSRKILSKAKERNDDTGISNGIKLVAVGRLEPQKAYGRLLHIVKNLREEGISSELWILGEGSERKMLEEYIIQYQLGDAVRLLGFQSNPYKYLAKGDLFICSSLAEGYSTAVTEALILGIPVITTDCSGMDELLKDGACGVITENSEQALYEGLKKLVCDVDLLKYYKERALERGKEFQIEALMKPIETLLMA